MSSLLHKIFQAGAFKMKAQRGNVWPMPLPYPEAHCRRKQKVLGKLQEKLAINYLVLVLDWLVMGEKLVDVNRIGLGTSLTSKQWEVVRRLAPLVRAWVDHEEVDSAAMGRSAVPVWSAAATCRGMGLHAKYLRDWQGGADSSDSSLSLGPTVKKILHVGHTDPVL